MTRIKKRIDLLIFRGFDKAVFSGGPPEGPTLLLKKLRGEEIDWKAIEETHTPSTRCRGPCLAVRFKDEFAEKEWRNKDDPHCKVCLAKFKEEGKTHRCVKCRNCFPRAEFNMNRGPSMHICTECKGRKGLRKCDLCEAEKPESEFPASRWNLVLQRRICLECSGARRCNFCPNRGDASKFSKEEWCKPDGSRKCKECVPKRCSNCKKAKVRSEYSKDQWAQVEGKATCSDCDRKRCGRCNKAKLYKDFDANIWHLADGSPEYCCRECNRGRRTLGMWMCANKRCKLQKPISDFSKAMAKHGNKVKGNSRICDECIDRLVAEEAKVSRDSFQQTQKKQRQ